MHRRRGFKLIEVLTLLALLSCVMGVLVPQYARKKERVKEAEVKTNLHNIQLAVERFAVDTEGSYPSYLIGGENRPQPRKDPVGGGMVTDLSRSVDPLIRRGYLEAYPRNPFMRGAASGADALALQARLPSSTVYGCDPLRPGTPEAAAHGTRFGDSGDLMGSVLADPRYRSWAYVDIASMQLSTLPTYADVEYDFWDMWQGGRPVKRWLPGEFFYKASGPIVAVGEAPDADLALNLPKEVDSYILGAYGGLKTQGKDILGPEQKFELNSVDSVTGERSLNGFWMWTRSEIGGPSDLQGSPYARLGSSDRSEVILYGNPNGIRDGLVLVLTAGEGWEGER